MNLNRYVESSSKFLNEVAEELGYPQDVDMALRVVRAVFSAMRDRLTIEESFDIMAQLPMLLKGIYVDGWRPSKQKAKIRDFEQFMAETLQSDRRAAEVDFGIEAESITETIQAVFRVLKRHLPKGEVNDITANLPHNIRDYWVGA